MPPIKTIESYFPTQIYRNSLPSALAKRLVPELTKESYLTRDLDLEGQRWSKKNYLGGYTSYSSITDLPFRSSNVLLLKKWIDRQVGAYARALELDLQGKALEMSNCWFNIMGQYSHHSFHLHPLSTISGTFYVQVPKGSGTLKLEDPRLEAFMGSPPRLLSAKSRNLRHINIEPKPGSLLLFESWLRHEVPANHSKKDRISISFNYNWQT
jgi:uncharacterized protein (TIGR02466 family)